MKLVSNQDRLKSAYHLLETKEFNYSSFQEARKLISGINPSLDKKLLSLSKIWKEVRKFRKSALSQTLLETLPETSREEKRRKKLLLLLLKNYKLLSSEIKRVEKELSQSNSGDTSQAIHSISKFIVTAKGPLGLITLAAVVIVGGLKILNNSNTFKHSAYTSPTATPTLGIQVIEYDGHQIPLDQLRVGSGNECLKDGKPAEHYHLVNTKGAIALNGEIIADPYPGSCGFGKVGVLEIINL